MLQEANLKEANLDLAKHMADDTLLYLQSMRFDLALKAAKDAFQKEATGTVKMYGNL